MKPTLGRIVHYQTDSRGGKRYVLPAIITCVKESHPDYGRTDAARMSDHYGVWYDDNPVPVPHGTTIHLHVMTPGPAGSYTELSVPFDDAEEPAPRSWHWPPGAPKSSGTTIVQNFHSTPEPEVRFVPVAKGGRGGGMRA